MTETVERRRHPRVAAEFALSIEPPSSATVRDISRAGVRCVSRVPFPPMTAVALRLELPSSTGDGEFREVACRGVVVRNRVIEAPDGHSDEEGPMFEAAIIFQDLEPEALDAIDGFVLQRLSSQTD